MAHTSRPVLYGFELPRPNSEQITDERIGTSVTLANGGIRGYTRGHRKVVTLSWAKLTEAHMLSIKTAAIARFVSYTGLDGITFAAEVDPPAVDAIPGTEPVRFSVSVTLRAQSVTS